MRDWLGILYVMRQDYKGVVMLSGSNSNETLEAYEMKRLLGLLDKNQVVLTDDVKQTFALWNDDQLFRFYMLLHKQKYITQASFDLIFNIYIKHACVDANYDPLNRNKHQVKFMRNYNDFTKFVEKTIPKLVDLNGHANMTEDEKKVVHQKVIEQLKENFDHIIAFMRLTVKLTRALDEGLRFNFPEYAALPTLSRVCLFDRDLNPTMLEGLKENRKKIQDYHYKVAKCLIEAAALGKFDITAFVKILFLLAKNTDYFVHHTVVPLNGNVISEIPFGTQSRACLLPNKVPPLFFQTKHIRELLDLLKIIYWKQALNDQAFNFFVKEAPSASKWIALLTTGEGYGSEGEIRFTYAADALTKIIMLNLLSEKTFGYLDKYKDDMRNLDNEIERQGQRETRRFGLNHVINEETFWRNVEANMASPFRNCVLS